MLISELKGLWNSACCAWCEIVDIHKRIITTLQVLFQTFSMTLCWTLFISQLLSLIVFCTWGLLFCCGNALVGTYICLVLIIFYSLILQRLAMVKNKWNLLLWLSILDHFSWCFYLFLYLIICLLMLQLKRESRELSVTLLYVQRYKTEKKKKIV